MLNELSVGLDEKQVYSKMFVCSIQAQGCVAMAVRLKIVYNTYSAQWSEGVELTCKHAKLTSPNDEALQKALKKRKQTSINADFSSRAKTNLDMVKNLNTDSFHVYKKQKRPVSVSTKFDEKVSVSLKVDENKEVPVELAESNLQRKLIDDIDDRDEYIRPLKKKLNLFTSLVHTMKLIFSFYQHQLV